MDDLEKLNIDHDPAISRIQNRNRRDILNAAMDVISKQGFEAATIQEISKRADISRSNIHYYFSTREELHREVLFYVIEVWDSLWVALDVDGSAEEQLTKYICAKLRASWEQPKLSRVFASEVFRGAPILQEHLKAATNGWFAEACAVVRNWMRRGELIDASPEHIFYAIWGATQYYADYRPFLLLMNDGKDMDEAQLTEAESTVCRMILGGLLTKND